jgi:hypothetical protein
MQCGGVSRVSHAALDMLSEYMKSLGVFLGLIVNLAIVCGECYMLEFSQVVQSTCVEHNL